MSEVLLLLLPTESLKLRPDPSVDIWVRSTDSGAGDQPIMCCPLLPPLTRILRALSQTKTCIIASTPSGGGMKDAVYSSIVQSPAYHHRRGENVRLRLELERLTRNRWVFPDFFRGFLDIDSMGRVTFLLPPDDVIMSETRTSLEPAVSSDMRRRYNWLLAKVKDTSKTKLYNNTH